MRKRTRLLPESISIVLRDLSLRGVGVVFCLLSLFLILKLFFMNPYLSGISTVSSMGENGIFGNAVSFMRYVIGFIPTLFLFLCLGRFGLSLFVKWDEERAPEYNLLRGFITLCIGCAGLGLMFPMQSFGGLFGAIVAADLSPILSMATMPIGILLFVLFMVMSAILLHIKWYHVVSALKTSYHMLRWVLSAFHLIKPIEPEEEYEEEEYEEEEEEDEEEEEVEEKPKRKRAARRKTALAVEHEYE